MNKDTLVTIIIPTWDNFEYLHPCLQSLLTNQATVGLMRIVVVNNGHPNSCDWVQNKQVTVVQTGGKNLGWEGGIMEGLKHTTSEFVVFFNDDAYVPPSSRMWLNTLLQHFKNPKVGAVGPASNVVMGPQNIFVDTGNVASFPATYLIGFCVIHRRELFESIGGMDMELPGGDDLDWSIRLRDLDYKLMVNKEVFIYHHGFKTGTRTMGDHQTAGGWNSYEMWHRTNTAIIKKHGLKKWWECMRGPQLSEAEAKSIVLDVEGDLIRGMVKNGEVTLDLGCGGMKTVPDAVGVDQIPKGEQITTLEGVTISQADLIADVSQDLPVEDGTVDVIIARHILEHMVNPITAIGLWGRKLRSGGRLIIAVPNQQLHSTIPMNIEHVHAFTPESLTNLLMVFGFNVNQVIDTENGVSFIAEAIKP